MYKIWDKYLKKKNNTSCNFTMKNWQLIMYTLKREANDNKSDQ